MFASATASAYRARYIFPMNQPPVRDGVIVVENGKVQQVGHDAGGLPIVDLENVVIMPGLCNAHTHLELSGFETPLGHPGQAFPAWIREVVQWRRLQATSPEEQLVQRAAAVRKGLQEVREGGVTEVYDIASPGWQHAWYEQDTASTTFHPSTQFQIFQEVLGLSTARSDALFTSAENALAQPHTKPAGFSPHAPYTVGMELLARLCRLSSEHRFPLAMHLAESREELELLQSHSGAFYALLMELEAWDPSAFPRGIRPLQYLQLLATAHRALVIHGNYLNDEETDFLAAHADRLTLVYCPRTHHYFRHARYPLPELLAKGVRVMLGTDSRASNPDLNLWDELRFVADAYPELSLETILGLAVKKEQNVLANFIAVGVPDGDPADPYELLFDSASRVRSIT